MLKQTIKRMVLTGATVMVMMSFAAPAFAQEGDYATQCDAAWGFGNPGNRAVESSHLQLARKHAQYLSAGGEYTFAPETAIECASTVQQSAAAP